MNETTLRDLETLAHAYQECEQPTNDGDHNYPWGTGYWAGIKFALDYISQRDTALIEELEEKKLLEVALSTPRLIEKQMYNKGLQIAVDVIKERKI